MSHFETKSKSSQRVSLRGWIKTHAERALAWGKRYPSKLSGALYMPPAAALGASGVFKMIQGEFISGATLLASGVAEVTGNSALIKWGDPEIEAHKAVGFVDVQDKSLWHRLTSPKQAPHEFSGLMVTGATIGLTASAVADPSAASITMAASCVLGTVASMVAERVADKPELTGSSPAAVFNHLVNRGAHWMQEKPLRAVFWMFAPCNIAQMVDGYLRKDPWMFASGAAYMAVNRIRATASKRTKIIEAN